MSRRHKSNTDSDFSLSRSHDKSSTSESHQNVSNSHDKSSQSECRSESTRDPCTCASTSINTTDEIKALCRGCDIKPRDRRPHTQITHFSRGKRVIIPDNCDNGRGDYCPDGRYDPGVSYFTSVVTPLTNLMPLYSGATGSVEFRMRRKNKTVTLQWEPFTGTMAASGVAYLTVAQSISNTPPYPVSFPIFIEYKSVGRITHIDINPNVNTGNIRFYLNTDGTATGIATGDAIRIPGGSITWIVD